jgi:hypothetical protein
VVAAVRAAEGTVTEEPDVPSRRLDLLRALVGARVTSLARHFRVRPAGQYEHVEEDVELFSLGIGPLTVTTDGGLTVRFGSDSSLMSVTVARGLDEVKRRAVEATDARYADPAFGALVGQRIVDVRVLRRDSQGGAFRSRPRQMAVVLRFEGGGELIASHGLRRPSDDFEVLSGREQIHPRQLRALAEELTLDELEAEQRA